MDTIAQAIGLLVILGVPAAIIVWFAWATRRPACPNCHYAVSQGDITCQHCGGSLPSSKTDHGSSATEVHEAEKH